MKLPDAIGIIIIPACFIVAGLAMILIRDLRFPTAILAIHLTGVPATCFGIGLIVLGLGFSRSAFSDEWKTRYTLASWPIALGAAIVVISLACAVG